MTASVENTPFAAIDFESAGTLPGATDVPVQIGIAHMEGTRIEPASFFRSYISGGQPITWRAQKVHGISDADLAGAPAFTDLWPELRNRLSGRWIVAHGSATERRFLRLFPLHGFGPWIDTLQLSRSLDPGLKSYALGDLAETYGLGDDLLKLVPGFRWHEALSDAIASLAILGHLISRFDLSGLPPEHLRAAGAKRSPRR